MKYEKFEMKLKELSEQIELLRVIETKTDERLDRLEKVSDDLTDLLAHIESLARAYV